VADKLGLMEQPALLCPKHYTIWRNSGWEWCLTFILLSGGEAVIKKFAKERIREMKLQEKAISGRSMDHIKAAAIVDAIRVNDCNMTAACHDLAISKATMYRQIKRFGIRIQFSVTMGKEKQDED